MLINQLFFISKTSYSIHNKFDLPTQKEESEQVDILRYTWEKLLVQAAEQQQLLVEIQPNFRGDLSTNIKQFQHDCKIFFDEYEKVYFSLPLNIFH